MLLFLIPFVVVCRPSAATATSAAAAADYALLLKRELVLPLLDVEGSCDGLEPVIQVERDGLERNI